MVQDRGWKIVVERKNIILTLETDEQGSTAPTSTEAY